MSFDEDQFEEFKYRRHQMLDQIFANEPVFIRVFTVVLVVCSAFVGRAAYVYIYVLYPAEYVFYRENKIITLGCLVMISFVLAMVFTAIIRDLVVIRRLKKRERENKKAP